MKRKEIQKIINAVLLTSYVGTLTPTYALEKIEETSTTEKSTNETTINKSVVKSNWLNKHVASKVNKNIEDLTDDDYLTITSLSLSGQDLLGYMPEEISKLKNLKVLDLSGCGLVGTIPSSLGELKNLEVIKLYANDFEGEIPDTLYNLTNLKTLELMSNKLSGTLSSKIGNLKNLETINLSNNKLSGSIPKSISNLTKLTYFDLEKNNISGEIPSEIGNLSNLESIRFANNKLTGSIPSIICNLSNLKHLNLSQNKLTGHIPSNIGALSNLSSINLYENNLEGSIPNSIGDINNLEFLVLHSNNLTGEIPASIGNLVNLRWLALQNNKLTGEIPAELTKLEKLSFKLSAYVSSFANNQLTGSVPSKWEYKKSDEAFENNFLTGANKQKTIKFKNTQSVQLKLDEILDVKSLVDNIVVANNKGTILNEELSSNLKVSLNYSNSQLLDNTLTATKIGYSSITGFIEGTNIKTTNSISLQTYNEKVSDNWINREVARQVDKNYTELTSKDYESITELDLSNKRLSGTISTDLYKLVNLTSLDLSNNDLSGELPNLNKLTKLKSVKLNNNNLCDDIDNVLSKINLTQMDFDLSYNQLTGNLPKELISKASSFSNNFINGIENQKSIKLQNKNFSLKLGNSVKSLGSISNSYVKVFDNTGKELNETLNPKLSLDIVVEDTALFDGKTAVKTGYADYIVVIKGTNIKSINSMTIELYNDSVDYNWVNQEIAKQLNKNIRDIVLGDYSKISELDLSYSNLKGAIPQDFYKLVNLKKLDLSNNKLSGPLPYAIISNLDEYDFSNNEFSGKLPSQVKIALTGSTLDASKFANNFIEGLDNQKQLVYTGSSEIELKVKDVLNSQNILSSIKVVDSNNSEINLNGYEIVVESSDANILNNNFVALKSGVVYLNACLKDSSTGEVVSKKENVVKITIKDTEAPKLTSKVNTTAWTNKAVTITVSATDNDGISKIVLPDGKTVNNANTTFSATKNGTYNFTAYDKAGNSKTLSVKISNIDATKPKATVTVSKPDKNNKVTITVKPTDSESNVKSVVIDSKTYAAKATNTVTLAKKNSYKVSVIDNAGNEYSTTAYSDTEAPKLTSKVSTTKWTNKAVTITVTATDNDAIDKIVLPDGKSVNAKTATYNTTKNGTYTFKAYDRAGNTKSVSIKVSNVDTTKPKATVSLSKIDKNNKVTITVKPTDSDSKVKNVVIDGKTYAAKATNTVTLAKKNSYKVSVIDNAGNEYSTTAKCDVEAPKMTSKLSTTAWTNKAVTITVTATDNDAIDKIVLPDGKTVKATKATYNAKANGTYKFTAYDKTGNTKTLNVKVSNIDTTKPKAAVSISKPDKNNKVTITVKPTDTNSKVKTVTFDGKSYAAKTTHTFTVTKNNSYKITVTDNAGNKVDYTAKVSSIPTKYTVNVASLSVRKTMSSKGTLLGTLKKNEKVDVYEIKNGWAKITYKNSTGYVASSSLKK